MATAIIAVGFAPARDRLQRWVDRRLYGERHDPVRAMTRLGKRLRDAPGGDVLAGVLQTVCETLRLPAASSLFLTAGTISAGTGATRSTGFGVGAGDSNISGDDETAIGYNALTASTSNRNTGVGASVDRVQGDYVVWHRGAEDAVSGEHPQRRSRRREAEVS